MKHTFTLIELVVVLGLTLMLAAVMVPGVCRAAEKARAVSCEDKLKSFGSAANMYTLDNDNYLGYTTNGANVWCDEAGWASRYILGPDAYEENKIYYRCPAAQNPLPLSKFDRYSFGANADFGAPAMWSEFSFKKVSDVKKNPAALLHILDVKGDGTDAGSYYASFDDWKNHAMRHQGKANVLFFDGHLNAAATEELDQKPNPEIAWGINPIFGDR